MITNTILYGKPVVEKIYQEIQKEIIDLKEKGIKPYLAVILVGEDPASLLYVKKKEELAQSLGIEFKLYHFSNLTLKSEVKNLISDLNNNKKVSGIIVQLPLPDKFDTSEILSEISPTKDIDCLASSNFIPPTAGSILEILKYYNISLENKKIVLVGRGKLVGKPLEKILSKMNLDLIICDSKTLNLKPITLSADIIISGVGKSGLITKEMVNNNSVVIDAGTAESNGKMTGDVEKDVYEKVLAISPVPGGVGPVTVASLMKNVVEAAKKNN